MKEPKKIATEAVEVCPHCGFENTFPNWNIKEQGFEVKCQRCGEIIMLCDECSNAYDNKRRFCDFHQFLDGEGTCWRKKKC